MVSVERETVEAPVSQQKPQDMSWESWVEQLIREARERGEFDNLPGAGKPLPGIDQPYDELWWARQVLEREQIAFLPETLRLRRDVELARDRIAKMTTEEQVLRAVQSLNERIRRVNSSIPDGPPSNVSPLDPGRVLARWRADHAPP